MAVYTALNINPVAPWTTVTADTVMVPNGRYISNGAASLNFTLPPIYDAGNEIEIIDSSGFGFVILQTMGDAAQQVLDLGLASTAGVTGTTTTTMAGQTIKLVAAQTNGAFRVDDNKGAFTYA